MSVSYRKVSRAVSSVDLDLTNPRLAGIVKRQAISTQKDAAIALTKSAEVYSLCLSIINNGYHPDEVLIAVDDESGKSNRVTVIEGNRRLSACKILLKPSMLKGSPDYNKFQRLTKHENYKESIKTIKRLSVVILQSRSEAASYLASKHTSDSIKRWSPYTQGAYLRGFLSEYKNVDKVKTVLKNSMSKTKIKEKLFHFELTEEILNLECWNEKELDFLMNGIDKLNVGAIIRFISSSDFIEAICDIKISDYGQLSIASKPASKLMVDRELFKLILEKLARDTLINGRINTRQENKESMRDYLNEFLEEFERLNNSELEETNFTFTTSKESEPDSKGSSSGTDPVSGDKAEESTSLEGSEDGSETAKLPRKKVEKLLPQSMMIPHANTKLLNICTEAQKISYKTNLYSSSLMIRAILEITLKVVIKRRNQFSELKKQHKERANDFAMILNFVEKNTAKIFEDEDVKVVRYAVSDLQKGSKELLNLTNHDDTQILTEKEVEHVRAKMLEIIMASFKLL
ncbi:hypothetical protein [Vibrio cyclitrophicus]|uniref:hypothetical protein n=1 Tax=Vibrio cyclitrophicus TaxID=47951 RepID=UPI000C8258FE|nr:hypothetical protein [Vibrio cyclitrophicus]PMF12446.1 hypothetical protein BCV20_00500 [Vibrio cyclitrophicus]